MKSKIQQKREEGFTIIEVLIVLAIAGLIILIVFLAVPALQRNSRNTTIKADVQNILGGVAEFQANNSGKMPVTISGTGSIDLVNGSITQKTNIQGATQVSSGTTAPAGTDTSGTNPSTGNIYVRIGARCDGTASTRAVAVYYQLENSGGTMRTCVDS